MSLQNPKQITIKSILGLLVLTVGTGIGIMLVQTRQLFNKRAAAPETTAVKIAEIAKEIGKTTQDTGKTTYLSEALGYSLNIDKNYWTPTGFTNLNQPNLSSLDFALNSNAGSAQVSFSVHNQKELDARIIPQKTSGSNTLSDNLDLLANSIRSETKPVSSERITRNGRQFYKFTYESTFLNQKSNYYQYVTLGTDSYYVITAKYSSFGDADILTERFIDSFSFTTQDSSVKGTSTKADEPTVLDQSKVVELTKPSVVQIAHMYCNKITIKDTSGLKYLKPSYSVCDGGFGSGFVINGEGFIATNGHVAVQYPDSAILMGIVTSNPFLESFLVDLIQELSLLQTGQEISPDQAKVFLSQAKSDPTAFQSLGTLIYQMIQRSIITLSTEQEKYYVKLSNQPMTIDTAKLTSDFVNSITPSGTIKEAKLVGFDYPNSYSVEAVLNNKPVYGTDVAIIKIIDPEGFIFPSVNLGVSTDLKSGSEIIVIGYPGLASSQGTSGLVNEQSSATPTITRGVVSAIKQDQAGNNLIQVDASIEHGNSGGPAFDMNGNVVGIATYGVGSQSGNYNFLRDVDDLRKLANSNSVAIGPSETYDEWEEGLGYFWSQKYKQASIPFNKVQTDYPVHPEVISYISDSQTAIDGGQDKSEFSFLIKYDRATQIKVGGSILLVILVAIGVVVFIKRRKSRLDIIGSQPQTNIPPQTMQPPTPITPEVFSPTTPMVQDNIQATGPQTPVTQTIPTGSQF